ncbi:MAG: hypothetical protein ACOX2O_04400 [Bdellovibrionota bacterium]|jgi:hypothetical protein
MDSKNYLVKIALVLAFVIPFTGCDSSRTSESGADDVGSVFVSDDANSGGINLDVNNTTLGIGGSSAFMVSVFDANGVAVPNVEVFCDSERGLAIVEPTTGKEMTDDYGHMSGVIGCEAPGSFRFGCRLPSGANKRKFVTVKCQGNVPDGFVGWPAAAGGTLGGGVDTTDQGGNNDGLAVRITSVTFSDANLENTSSIDAVFSANCGENGNEPEAFTDAYVTFKYVNNSSALVRITSYAYTVDGYTSPRISVTSSAVANGGSAEFKALFLKARNGGKSYYGTTETIPPAEFGFKNFQFYLYGENSFGEEIVLSAGSSVSIDNFNSCTK